MNTFKININLNIKINNIKIKLKQADMITHFDDENGFSFWSNTIMTTEKVEKNRNEWMNLWVSKNIILFSYDKKSYYRL